MPADPLWGETTRDAASTSTHSVQWTAKATDTAWAANGGPTEIILDVIDVTNTWSNDRVPLGKATLHVAPPLDGSGNPLLRWLSPLNRTCQIELWVTITLPGGSPQTRSMGTFQLRRRALRWPIPGDVTLDVASWDGAHAEDMADYDLTHPEATT